MGFFQKNCSNFSKSLDVETFSRIRPKWYLFLEILFHLNFEDLLSKNQRNFEIGKAGENDEETECFGNKIASRLLEGVFNNGGGHKKSRRYPGVLL